MNRGRGEEEPPPGQAAPSKPNRLRRSFRRTQQTQTAAELDSPKSQQPDFKTPTRIQRPRAGDGFSAESSFNDSDFQQDIIWDATSPSPSRHGKRGKKQRAGVVDISEIVSRIAPKHGRPKVAEPTLQQWIGDSATIPCTPDVQAPKPKKKSPRPSGVDDLLKLAKQFDFNMFHQDEEEEAEHQSPELLSGDVLEDLSPQRPGLCDPVVKDVQLQLDQLMEDDLDFLFDGPTQQLSGNLSQVTSQVKASGAPTREASGKPSAASDVPTSTNNTKASGRDAFEDDWENDDLLDDSLVLEMTQNPQNFAAPALCSTQKLPSPGSVSSRSAAPTVEKDDLRQRATFKLESKPKFSFKRLPTDTWTSSRLDHSPETGRDAQGRFPSGNAVSAGTQRTWQTSNTGTSYSQVHSAAKHNMSATKTAPVVPVVSAHSEAGTQRTWQTANTVKSYSQVHQRTSAFKHNTSATKTAPVAPVVPVVPVVPASDLLDEDLSAFFLSDPVWDDPADDDLLCEMCDDVENQMKTVQNVPGRQTLPVPPAPQQRAVLQPSNRIQQPERRQRFPQRTQPPAAPRGAAGFSCDVSAGVQIKTSTDSFRTVKNSACVQANSRGESRQDQVTFKRPNIPVSTGNGSAVGKCSAAEIELKKQQAMERRRQRLQAAQNLRVHT